MKPASRFDRCAASILDGLILGAAFAVIALLWFIVSSFFYPSDKYKFVIGMITIVYSFLMFDLSSITNQGQVSVFIEIVFCLYHVLYESSRYQATPGKRIMRLCVISNDRKKLSFGRALFRYVLFVCPAFLALSLVSWQKITSANIPGLIYLLFIFIWFGPILLKGRKGVHDILTQTSVVSSSGGKFPR